MKFNVIILSLALLGFLGGCKAGLQKPEVEWFLHFADGTNFPIDYPTYVSRFYACASEEYWRHETDAHKIEVIEKYVKRDGYAVRIDGKLSLVPVCKEIK